MSLRAAGVALLGLLLVAGFAEGRLLKWRFDEAFGETGRGRNELRRPVDVVLTPDDDVVVLDRDREALVFFSRSGRWLRTLGGRRGEGELRLKEPSALRLDEEGRFWVVDQGNHRIVVVDGEGSVLQVVGSLGTADGRFRYPADLTFDDRGRVYVADSRNERIQVFRSDGTFLDSWDRRTGGRRDVLGEPVAVAYTPEGREGIWVVNRGSSRLQRFDLEGDWEESRDLQGLVDGDLAFHDLEVEPTFYRMFLADREGQRILALDRRGALMDEIGPPPGGSWGPRGLFVNRQMDLAVADETGSRVLKYETE